MNRFSFSFPPWYLPRREEQMLVRALLGARHGEIRAALLEGPPGCGKTSLAKAVAEGLGGAFLYSLLHSWSDDQELFYGLNIQAVVAGEPQHVRQPGVLAVAAELSAVAAQEDRPPVVVCLDEVDKVQERTEYLLLDFLESGRVPVRPGEHVQAVPEKLLVFLTTNATRPISDPLLRRVRRCRMSPLSDEALISLLGGPDLLNRILLRLFRAAERAQGTLLSLAELRRAREDLQVCESLEECEIAVRSNFDRTGEWRPQRDILVPLWGEVKKCRR